MHRIKWSIALWSPQLFIKAKDTSKIFCQCASIFSAFTLSKTNAEKVGKPSDLSILRLMLSRQCCERCARNAGHRCYSTLFCVQLFLIWTAPYGITTSHITTCHQKLRQITYLRTFVVLVCSVLCLVISTSRALWPLATETCHLALSVVSRFTSTMPFM